MERPWFQFHTRDWLDNKELRRCSPTARAILADLMCLAHEGAAYGFLEDKVDYLTEAYMASRCCVTRAQFRKAWFELVRAERIHESEVDPGRFYIKRMVEDETTRLARAAGGSLGGNPKLTRKVNLTTNLEGNQAVNGRLAYAHVPRSDSGSDSESSGKEKKQESGIVDLQRIWFEELFWPIYWRKVSKEPAFKAFRRHAATEEQRDRIIAAVRAHTAGYLARDAENRPHAATWLNARRYEEPFDESPPSIGGTNGHMSYAAKVAKGLVP